jgi:hypothetical protein
MDDDANAIEPLGFFTLDALRAGWYLAWRQLVRIALGGVAAGIAGALLAWLGLAALAAIVLGLGVAAVTIWALILVPRLTIQWAEQWYGATLTGQVRIWWGVVWRSFVASLVAAVIFTPPNFVAMSLSTAFGDSLLGLLGGLLLILLSIANCAVTLLATGWAMSKVAVEQIAAGATVAPAFPPLPAPVAAAVAVPAAPLEPAPLAEPGLDEAPAPVAAVAAAAVPAPPPARPAPVATAARPAAAGERRQCPKCSLYETERGTVIGWYCKVCGWREGRGR